MRDISDIVGDAPDVADHEQAEHHPRQPKKPALCWSRRALRSHRNRGARPAMPQPNMTGVSRDETVDCNGGAASCSGAWAQDPIQTDGDKYKVKFENERVRVLEYRDQPGVKSHLHHHPAFVLYALAPFKRRITLSDGRVLLREFKIGDVLWSDAQTHIGENVGDTPTHVIMVEFK